MFIFESISFLSVSHYFDHFFRAICKLVNNKPSEWDKHLDAVMFGLRTKTQMTTKFSPFYLMFGREARYPSQVPEEYRVGVNKFTFFLVYFMGKGSDCIPVNCNVYHISIL